MRFLIPALLILLAASSANAQKPNIVYILADDLGYGEVGVYGQEKIKTPNIDSIAREGIKFTQHYSGGAVCAPSRCVLLTGKHTGRSYVRGNREMGGWGKDEPEGQLPIPAETLTLAELLQEQGYVTGCIGKWGLGGPESAGHPNKQGFDHYYGYLCQRVAHNYYPTHLWRNGEKHTLDNEYFASSQRLPVDADPNDPASYEPYVGNEYAQDLMAKEALWFIDEHKDEPFFLYLPFPVPHLALQVPEDSLEQYKNKFNDTPYPGGKGYLPHQYPRAAYAAMITRMDRHIGAVLDKLEEHGLAENTLVIFTSDNGASYVGGYDREFFQGNGPLRGRKGQLYEGGIRVPMVARWPGKIAPGTTTDHPSMFDDVLPTFAEIIDFEVPADVTGVSFLPTLLGKPDHQKTRDYMYWEHAANRGSQAVRMGDWKGIRLNTARNPDSPWQLYNLANDLDESENLANQHPDIVEKIDAIAKEAHVPSKHFKFVAGE